MSTSTPMEEMPHGAPRLSVVLPADRPETVRRMRAALRAQTARAALEIVVVRWPGAWVDDPNLDDDGFAAVRLVDMAAGTPLPLGRAAGVRAASAPLLFLAETHAYPRPEWAEAVLAAFADGSFQVVSSAFLNGNPDGAVNWAAFILDYGDYSADHPAGERPSAPIHKGVFPRADLLALGDRLAPALSSGDELAVALQARGRRAYFEPRARIDHMNVSRLRLWLRGTYLIGFMIGANRSDRWSVARRALYTLLAPLIPAVLAWRLRPTVRRIGSYERLPAGLWPALVLGASARAAGEAVGYARGHQSSLQKRADAYELVESLYTGASVP